MTSDEFLAVVGLGERPGVEFKNARSRKDRNVSEVIRAVIGMANRRDGGMVIVGVKDDGEIQGLTPEQVASWEKADDVRQTIAPYVDPHAYVDVAVISLPGAPTLRCVVLQVQEFDQVPVLCAKSATDLKGELVLRQGACYVRSRQLPSTTEIADHAQFRELLDLAIDKGVREFVRRSRSAGLEADNTTDQDRFRAQRESAFK
jgi:predicted HTH transcriptional regulator